MDKYITLQEASEYASVSIRTIRQWLKQGLKHARVSSRTIRTKVTWIDEFLGKHEVAQDHLQNLVDSVIRDLSII